jgi:uncharacterized protein (TIGR02996 family)
MDLLAQHEAFLRAIFDAPDDDTPRLVYADFLQENGEDDRAALIRLQCELIRLRGRDGADPYVRELVERLDRITERYPDPVGRYVRGFGPPWKTMALSLDQLHDPDGFRRYAVASVPECFAVEGVKLCDGRITSGDPFDVLFGLRAFARVTELDLQGTEIEEGRTTDSPFTPFRLEPVITTAGVEALVRHRGARKLTALILTNNNLDNDAARALVKSAYLDNLKRLDLLEGNRLRGKVWQQVIARFGEDVVG